MDTSWTIDTADDGTLTTSGVEGDSLPMFHVGESYGLTFFLGPELANNVSDYNTLREFGRYAGESTIDTGTDIRGKPWYRERLHPQSTFSTTLVKLVPGADVGNLQNYWALVTGVTDETAYVGAGERLTVECYILAEASQYNSRDDIEADLKADL